MGYCCKRAIGSKRTGSIYLVTFIISKLRKAERIWSTPNILYLLKRTDEHGRIYLPEKLAAGAG